MENFVTVLGAGLAGCEAAWALAQKGIKVHLFEMKPISFPRRTSPRAMGSLCAPIP